MTSPSAGHRRRVIVRSIVLSVIIAVLAAAAWVVVRGVLAAQELRAIDALAGDVQTALTENDTDGLIIALDTIGEHAAQAASLTSDPVWRAAELVPAAGPNLVAARVSAEQADAVVSGVALPLAATVRELAAGIRLDDGRIDLDLLVRAHAAVRPASATLTAARAAIDDVDTAALVSPLRAGVEQLRTLLDDAAPLLQAADEAGTILPSLLGADGPRTILVAAQNNAELRTGGGIMGSFAEIRADNGSLTLVDQTDSQDFTWTTDPVIAVPESTTSLYSDVVGRFVQNASTTPDFAVTADLVTAWWTSIGRTAPDVVVSIDPIVLREILRATGPLPFLGGELTADNMVDTLLVEPYVRYSSDEQTAIFEEAVELLFDRVTSSDIDLMTLAGALAAPVEQGRVSVWSAHGAEQAVLAASDLAGPAARHRAAGSDAVAVYFNDATGAKLDTLLDVQIAAGTATCRADGLVDLSVRVTLTSEVHAAQVASWPTSVTGGGLWGFAPGQIATIVSVAAPEGFFDAGVTVDGERVAAAFATDAGFPTSAQLVELSPGTSSTTEFRFTGPEGSTVDTVLSTPMLRDPSVELFVPDCG